MNTRLRHDAIVRSLRRNGTLTVAELAEEVGASRRTVLRDISALRDEGFVIHSEPGRGGGLQLDPQSVQTTARLSVAEVFALLISVACMRAAGNLLSVSQMPGLPKLKRPCPRIKSGICAGFWIACMLGSFHRRLTYPIWASWSPRCYPHSRKLFFNGSTCVSNTVTQKEL